MVHQFFNYFVRRTHFWRYVGFAEMAELYASRMLRVMALQIISGFSIIYIYQLGYSLQFIAWYLCGYFLLRIFLSPFIAIIIARYGPKHSSLVSNILQIIGAFIIIFLPVFGPVTLLLFAPIAGIARSLYDVSYLVDFSKVKHVNHSGKELGVMQIVERIMVGAGPLIGGFIALFFGAQLMMVFGAVLMLLAALPLFFTGEPVKVRQKITLRHFNWKVAWRPLLASIGVGVDVNISGIAWGLFMAIIVFGIKGNDSVYAQIGGIASLSILSSVIVSYMYGKIVDNKHGKLLLKVSVIGDVIVHLLRPLVVLPWHALTVNTMNEVVTTGYAIPATRSVFDTADGLPGYRIVYLTLIATFQLVGDLLASVVLLVLVLNFSETTSLHVIFYILAPFVGLAALHSYSLYKQGILTKYIHRV